MNIEEFYSQSLTGADTSIPKIKSWELIEDRNKSRLDSVAISEGTNNISYGEMFDDWKKTAKVFSSLGISREDDSRVLAIMPNLANTCSVDYACDITGAVVDFIDPTTSLDKIKKYIDTEKITDLYILDLLCMKTIGKEVRNLQKEMNLKNIVVYKDPFISSQMPGLLKRIESLDYFFKKFDGSITRFSDASRNSLYSNIKYDTGDCDDLSLITHTSGTTTGIGKPIPMTDYKRNAIVRQYELAKFNYQPGMTMMHFIPYFAGYGAINTTHLGLSQGLELQQLPLFQPSDFGKYLSVLKPNVILANTPCWLNLINDSKYSNIDLSFLVYAAAGGSPTTIDQENLINDFLVKHNSPVLLTKGFGLSEFGGCCATTIDGFNKVGSMGVRLPLSDIKIRDISTGAISDYLPNTKMTGEAIIHTPSMTSGTLDAKVIVPTLNIDGKDYIATKDVIEIDEIGNLSYIDRIDRMFPRYDAYNVYPLYIESMLQSYDEIEDCAIVSSFDENLGGAVPKVIVSLSSEIEDKKSFISKIIKESFIDNSRQSTYLANYRDIPHIWVFVENIPKNTMGKTDFFKLTHEEIDGSEYYVETSENNMKINGFDVICKKDKKILKLK